MPSIRTTIERIRREYRDPRLYQITVLSGLLLYGATSLAFDLDPMRCVAMLLVALATQAIASKVSGLPRIDLRSALISSLSLCLLLRTDSMGWAVGVAAITILSKFIFRWNGRHFFNPTNIGLVIALLLTDHVWVSHGQWGSVAVHGLFFAGLGGLVVRRAARGDITYAFFAAFAAILFGRTLYLGEPLAIPMHRLENGALLIFTFFMISDPKTTPDSRPGRLLYAAIVAIVGAVIRFGYHDPNALLYALAMSAPLVPVLDRLLPGDRYLWTNQRKNEGDTHAIPQNAFARLRAGRLGRYAGVGLLRLLRRPSGRRSLQPSVEGHPRP